MSEELVEYKDIKCPNCGSSDCNFDEENERDWDRYYSFLIKNVIEVEDLYVCKNCTYSFFVTFSLKYEIVKQERHYHDLQESKERQKEDEED